MFVRSFFAGVTLTFAVDAAYASDIASRIAAAFETAEYFSGNGLAQIGASTAYSAGFTGAGTLIAVIDNGFQLHADFAAKVVEEIDTAIGGGSVPVALHGTHVAGIAAAFKNDVGMHGVAYDANLALYTAGVAPNPIPGNTFAFQTAAALRPDVINNSWGYDFEINEIIAEPSFATNRYQAIADATGLGSADDWEDFADAMQQAQQNSVIVFAASNDASFTEIDISSGLPLILPQLRGAWLAVVNVENGDTLLSGPCGSGADFCLAAPGTEINSTVPTDAYDPQTGTSMAAPHVSGAVAIGRQIFPDATPEQLAQLVLQTATDIGATGVDNQFGWGLLNLANMALTIDPQTGDLFPTSTWSLSEALQHFGVALRDRLADGAQDPAGNDPSPGSDAGPDADSPEGYREAHHFWATTVVGLSNLSAGATSRAYQADTVGFVIGADGELENGLRLGIAAGYTRQMLDSESGDNGGEADGFHFGGYGAFSQNPWRFEASAQFAYFDQNLTRRTISGAAGTSGAPVGTSSPETIAGEGAFRAGRVYEKTFGTVMPFVEFSARGMNTEHFTETGAGIFSLSVPRSSIFQTEIGFGLRAQGTLTATDSYVMTGSTELSYDYLMGDRGETVYPTLLGRPIATTTAQPGAHIANVSGQLTIKSPEDRWSASLAYRGRIQDNAFSHSGSATLQITF